METQSMAGAAATTSAGLAAAAGAETRAQARFKGMAATRMAAAQRIHILLL
jgi:hypothetical protein